VRVAISTLRRTLVATAVVAAALGCPSVAAAKSFAPGDVRLCGAARCVVLVERPLLQALSTFVYGGRPPVRDNRPARGSRTFALRLRDGAVAAIVGGRRLDRIRVHGLVCGRFGRGRWYRLPTPIGVALTGLGTGLVPRRLGVAVPRSC
jgi:hypothetical protein